MIKVDNEQKYFNYKIQMDRLNRAMRGKFYFEAVMIEYNIIDDRLKSLIKHSGRDEWKKGSLYSRTETCRKLLEMDALACKYVSDELLCRIDGWRKRRNDLVHELMDNVIEDDELQTIAECGYDITKELKNKVNSYKRACDRQLQKMK